MSFIKTLFGIGNEAEIKRLIKIRDRVEAQETAVSALSDAQLRGKTDEFKARIAKGETLDDLLPEAFAVAKEAAYRAIGQRPFPTQTLAGIVLHQGRIAEMLTGEGKTLSAVMPVYLNALSGKGVHIVTVNDYLARFQGEWMGRIYAFLGLSTGLILHDLDNDARRAAYNADITYGTNNEFGFDYLRDNMVVHKEQMVQRELNYAIVDEVDSILIDEARTPLIISGAGEKSTELYTSADRFARTLHRGTDFEVDEKLRNITLSEEAVHKAERFFGLENLSDIENTAINHHIQQALKANVLFKRDVDYVVQERQVVIVDEFTGRLMEGRRYSEGLHQAIEAKERVPIARESKTLATITFQNFFRMYNKLSGMTGTAKTEEEEFRSIYGLDVVTIPTFRPMIRQDQNDLIYKNEQGKYNAVVEEVAALHAQGRPVLVGTVSVEKSELLSSMLQRRGVEHVVLNAKHHEKEAEIVAQAGKIGAVTIATNMAGRGTDILLGGNPEFLARKRMEQEGYADELIEDAQGHSADAPPEVVEARRMFAEYLAEYRRETDVEHEQVVALGGLCIIGTERHESRRIDNQLRGRAGRQGDPGSSRFYVALEDVLMRRFGGDRITPLVERLGMDDETPLETGLLSKQIEAAQKRVEGHNFDVRKHLLQYDDVMNTQRSTIYQQRREVLEGADMRPALLKMLREVLSDIVSAHCPENMVAEEWEWPEIIAAVERYFPLEGTLGDGYDVRSMTEKQYLSLTQKKLLEDLYAYAEQVYNRRAEEAEKTGVSFAEIERVVMLRAVDDRWMDHIDDMDQLRYGIGLRAIGHHDPVVEFKREGYDMFENMIHSMQQDALYLLFHVSVEKQPERQQRAIPMRASHGDEGPAAKTPVQRTEKKVGRNEPCPCGSGKKYKHCCGRGA